MKKKIVSALMVAAMVVTAFEECGSDKGGTSTQGGDKTKNCSGKVYLLNFKNAENRPKLEISGIELYRSDWCRGKCAYRRTVGTATTQHYNFSRWQSRTNPPSSMWEILPRTDTGNDYTYDLKDSEVYKHLTDKSR